MKLFIKTDKDGKVVEACPQRIEGADEVSCTQDQFNKIYNERYDGYSDGVKITSVEAGEDNKMLLEQREAEAEKMAELKAQA